MTKNKNSKGNVKSQPKGKKKGGQNAGSPKHSDSPPSKKSQTDQSNGVQPDSTGGTASFQKEDQTVRVGELATGEKMDVAVISEESSSRNEVVSEDENEVFDSAEESFADEISKQESSDKLNLDGGEGEKLTRRQKKNKKAVEEKKPTPNDQNKSGTSKTGRKKKETGTKMNESTKKSKPIIEPSWNKDELKTKRSSNVGKKMYNESDGKRNLDEERYPSDGLKKMTVESRVNLSQVKNKSETDRPSRSGSKNNDSSRSKPNADKHDLSSNRSSHSRENSRDKSRQSSSNRSSNSRGNSRDNSHRRSNSRKSSHSHGNSRENSRGRSNAKDKGENKPGKTESSKSSGNVGTLDDWLTNDWDEEDAKDKRENKPGKAESSKSSGNVRTSDNWPTNDWEENWEEEDAKDEGERSIKEAQRMSLEKKRMRRSNESAKDPKDDSGSCVTEIDGDLFEAPENMALAHCVGADLKMGAGIAVRFRQEFGKVGELMDQRVGQGGVAYIQHKDRYVFYLVTKTRSTGKPTYGTMERSLMALHDKCKELGVEELAMPRIGCGLDGLEWFNVKAKLNEIFSDGIKITVYNYNEEEESKRESKPPTKWNSRGTYIKNENLMLVDIAPGTGLLYIASVEHSETGEMKSLNTKYPFLDEAKTQRLGLGEVLRFVTNGEVVYGLVCRKTVDEPIHYRYLEIALQKLKRIEKREETYSYFGIQAFEDKTDQSVMTKIETLLRHSLSFAREVWICWPKELQHLKPESRY